jgi:hypothetical protein
LDSVIQIEFNECANVYIHTRSFPWKHC